MELLRIKHIGELYGTVAERTLLIASDADYCTACGALRKDFAAAYGNFWIRHEHHFVWLRAFVDHAGIAHVRDVEFTRTIARDLLGQQLGLPIPEWLTDELILGERLLERVFSPSGYTSVDTMLVAPTFGELSTHFPWSKAGMLAELASAPKTKIWLNASPINRLAWENLLQTWAGPNVPPWAGAFCEYLRAAPADLWRELTIWRLLNQYPEAEQDFALDSSTASLVRKVPVEALKKMVLDPVGRSTALDQIRRLFESAESGGVSRQKFDTLTSYVSGALKEEFDALQSLLENALFKIAPYDIELIKRRFDVTAIVDADDLSRLDLYVPPAKPVLAETSTPMDAAAWKKWFHTEYLPYRWWQTESKSTDADVEKMVARFSDWYCQDFLQVHSDPALSSVQLLGQWRSLILEDTVSLILLVDNLPWFFWDTFERSLRDAGLHEHESHDCFVPLPSNTSVCKPALISGRWDVTGSDYRKMLEKRSAEEWGGKSTYYLGGVDQLAAFEVAETPAVLLLNYLASDEALHSDLAAAGRTHADLLGGHFQALGKAVGKFAKRAGEASRNFGLYVITDHGATRILEGEKQSVDAKLSQRLFSNEKHRSAEISAAEASQIPDNLWELGHKFANPYRHDGTVYFIPRGHNTVASPGKRPLYCHGGATPEEVITPCGVFRLHAALWTKPNVRFVDAKKKSDKTAFYVKRMTTVTIEVQNPNSDECRLDSIKLIPPVGELRSFGKIAVGPNETAKTTMNLYFSTGATAIDSLIFEFTFLVAQEELVQRVALPVTISSAAAGGIDLTSLT